MKKFLCAAVFMCAFCTAAFSQEITTASDFFKSVSDRYAEIKDYEADIDITIDKNEMKGKISFKRPEMLRIDFSDPAEQVVVFNRDDLTIYLPSPTSAILEQNVTASGPNAATAQGLSLLRRYYTVAYESGQSAVPLDENSDEMVVNLLLSRRSAAEAFRTIKLSVDPSTKLIRRVAAVSAQDVDYIFDFHNYNLNVSISDQRFIYDPPSSANNYNNFLLSE
ncbi:MAG TPA: outer membrane lipoprotein carrier protein LolA [Treponema sp.]|nr:outer membrane lipoprotein carrier protein LolA [Treponema sp.]